MCIRDRVRVEPGRQTIFSAFWSMTHIPPLPTRSSTSPRLLSPPSSLLSSPPLRSRPLKSSKGSGERCKLPQRVRVEPGRQTIFSAFWLKNASGESYFKGIFTKNMFVFSLFTSNNAASVATRGCLPPGAKVCVAATANQISSAIRVFSGFRTWGVNQPLVVPFSSLLSHFLHSLSHLPFPAFPPLEVGP